MDARVTPDKPFHLPPGYRVMDRRAFIGGLAFGTLAAPHVARAQPERKVYRIGILSSRSTTSEMVGPQPQDPLINALLRGLREFWNVPIELLQDVFEVHRSLLENRAPRVRTSAEKTPPTYIPRCGPRRPTWRSAPSSSW